MPRAWLALPAFAKVNLSLEVLGPRQDGFTEIRTVYQTVSLHDRLRLRLTRRAGVWVRVPGGGAPSGTRNLVYRALTQSRALVGWRGGIEAELEKNIPAARGLGGGSSDAAAAVLGLLRLTRTPPGRPDVERLLRGLGSDVPFFLHGGCALGVGRGEEVYPLPDLPWRWCVLVCPPREISTREAYGWVRPRRLTPRLGAATIANLGLLQGLFRAAGNDFEPAVFPRYPKLRRLRSALRDGGAEWCALSGSGSALFGLFARRRQAQAAANRLAGEGTVFLAETLSREAYRRALGPR